MMALTEAQKETKQSHTVAKLIFNFLGKKIQFAIHFDSHNMKMECKRGVKNWDSKSHWIFVAEDDFKESCE